MNQVTQPEIHAVEQTAEVTPQPTPAPKTTLIHTLLHAINEHLDKQVDAKVSAVLEAHSAVRYIDEAFKEAIKDIAYESVQTHNDEDYHLNDDNVRDIMAENIEERVRREIRDIDISDQIHDAITDYDFDDKIDSFDFDDKIETYLSNNDYPDADRVCEIVDEIVEEKVMGVLKKLLEKLNGV